MEISKKKRKLRAMTNAEFCDRRFKEHPCCRYFGYYKCPNFYSNCTDSTFKERPCRINGKYILIEVKE